MSAAMDDQILTLEEVSRYLKVNKATIYRLAQAGRIPASKVGKVWRFKRDRIETWFAGQERRSVAVRTSRTRRRG